MKAKELEEKIEILDKLAVMYNEKYKESIDILNKIEIMYLGEDFKSGLMSVEVRNCRTCVYGMSEAFAGYINAAVDIVRYFNEEYCKIRKD